MGHDCANYNGDENARDDGEASDHLNRRQRPIHVETDQDDYPTVDDIGDEDVPLLRHDTIVHDRIHGHGLYAEKLKGRGKSEEPGQAIPPASKPAARTSVPARRHCCPVIYCSPFSASPSLSGAAGARAPRDNIPPPAEGMAEANSAIEAATKQQKNQAAMNS